MSDATFYLLDSLLAAAKGMLISHKAASIKQEYRLTEDPRSTLLRIGTKPSSVALLSFLGSYALNKSMVGNADQISQRRNVRYFQAP